MAWTRPAMEMADVDMADVDMVDVDMADVDIRGQGLPWSWHDMDMA